MWSVMCLVVFSLFMPSKVGVLLCMSVGFLMFFLLNNYSFFFSSYLLKTSIISMDSLAYYFVLLSLILFLLIMFLNVVKGSSLFFFFLIGLFVVLLFFFSSVQALYFFIFFEISFIFMFLIIVFWGAKPERVESLKYFIIYSLVGSLPLLSSIVMGSESVCSMGLLSWGWVHYVSDSFCHMDDMSSTYTMEELKSGLFSWDLKSSPLVKVYYGYTIPHFFWMLVFLFKFPVFGLHLWLPKAHVESPVYGSMLLAGMMIKLGVMGIFRLNFRGVMFYYSWSLMKWFFFYFCVSIIMVNLICSRQYDLKSFVAYSSMVHMSLMVMSMWTGTVLVVVGTVLMSFAHGLCSSALFLNFKKFYEVSGTRNVYLNRGFVYMFSSLCFFWFVFSAVKCSVPLSLTFFSEVFLIFSGVVYNYSSVVVFLFNVFFCGMYCMILYLLVSHGKKSVGINFKISSLFKYSNLLVLGYHFFLVYFYLMFFDTFGGLM